MPRSATKTEREPFSSAFGECCLDSPGGDMRAWNQADAYLLDTLAGRFAGASEVATVNDTFGALTSSLSHLGPSVYNDSAMFLHYLKRNWPAEKPLPVVAPIDALGESSAAIFLLRLPKNLHFFRYQLSLLAGLPECTVLVAGMQKHWPASFYQASEAFFARREVLPGVKKAKLMILDQPMAGAAVEREHHLRLDAFGLHLCNLPNVFAREQLDIGSRFFLQHFPDLGDCSEVLDLACGNGVLGIYALQKNPALRMHFVDESALAIASCKASVTASLSAVDHCHYYHNHILHDLQLPAMDAVLCNPPFHQQHVVSDTIAVDMIAHSHRCLKPGGSLYLIGNRHLPYYAALKQSFRHVMRISGDHKFSLYRASK